MADNQLPLNALTIRVNSDGDFLSFSPAMDKNNSLMIVFASPVKGEMKTALLPAAVARVVSEYVTAWVQQSADITEASSDN